MFVIPRRDWDSHEHAEDAQLRHVTLQMDNSDTRSGDTDGDSCMEGMCDAAVSRSKRKSNVIKAKQTTKAVLGPKKERSRKSANAPPSQPTTDGTTWAP
ncbi:hypothetical protein HBH98_192700 [Parastagonospora nodorum]|nr:hypothetical protein HBH53_114570 [Parastagonospora nodorum]KAH4064284.1 hypothetical protein HBH50_177180 [Parastagonospora nodorum]KAH4084295.1 hypothetical protein HBH48_167310 [Parastagonospora nodorum]KAH4095523.1 hypothetical protein HBH46_166940 [Parastagonospora nodorum]KAH4116785.1 hypothetical protein HBH47_161440 [Parastagonospora nodorum]